MSVPMKTFLVAANSPEKRLLVHGLSRLNQQRVSEFLRKKRCVRVGDRCFRTPRGGEIIFTTREDQFMGLKVTAVWVEEADRALANKLKAMVVDAV